MLKKKLKGMNKMKKILYGLFILLIGLFTINVEAANYGFKELIPVGVKNTLVTNNFSYQQFYYDESGQLIFKNIKNLSDKDLPISISIAFFDENKRNMGIMNYCNEKEVIGPKANKENHTIEVTESEMGEGKNIKDIKYIAILTDNVTCTKENSFEYVGSPLDDIGMGKNNELDTPSIRLIHVMEVVFGLLFLLFLYEFLFTKRYQNFDGSETRAGFKKYNKELKREREEELRKNPPKPKEFTKVKTDEVLEQEEKAKKEDKSATDLHNLYK